MGRSFESDCRAAAFCGAAACRGAALWAVVILAVGVVTLVGCREKPVLLLTVSAESRVESYDLTVRKRSNQEIVLQLKGEPVDSDNPLRDISEPGEALRLALTFQQTGHYLVLIVGRSMNATQVAT